MHTDIRVRICKTQMIGTTVGFCMLPGATLVGNVTINSLKRSSIHGNKVRAVIFNATMLQIGQLNNSNM